MKLKIPLGLALFAWAVSAQAATPPAIDARAWLLLDVTTGQELASSQADSRIEPASLTKIMTAYLIYEDLAAGRLALEQPVRISTRAWRVPPGSSRMFLEPGQQVSVAALLTGLMVQSGNDAAVALAEASAGSVEAFVTRMNERAAALGLSRTRFASPAGLPDPQTYSTARDLARLAQRYVADFPQWAARFDAQREFEYGGIRQRNRNRLLWQDSSVDGIKTGHTGAAGYCLIATASRDEQGVARRLIAVVTGTDSDKSRTQAGQALLDWGYQAYDLAPAWGAPANARVWMGAADQVSYAPRHAPYLAVPAGQIPERQVVLNAPLRAPLQAGQQIGQVRWLVGGQVVGQAPLLAGEAVAPASAVGRMMDAARLWVGETLKIGPGAGG
ncbi:D-alanyl-D-alanine carboxypeptidase family protein [Bordetella genomosp. 12]|uniref:serine-type D-Ala-D-Ala carboxypeptidase n=1 Tax=Bordetella genomosp. 12 TaxID=463035 RepID=A0A261VD68_9BORD|nr:D-alanyl-D-alanine carboxypeptidase family protein [Bordetella genomosp. 12]OZI71530.1 peptidase [Bordetella genomosp. 12]